MNVNTDSTVNFTVYGKTRAGNHAPLPAGTIVSVPHGVGLTYDPVGGKGSFSAPASTGTDTFTASDGALTPYVAPLTYIQDPNEIVALDVTFP